MMWRLAERNVVVMNPFRAQKGNPMKTSVFISRGLILLLAVVGSPAAQAVWVEEEISTNNITVTASSEYGLEQSVKHLIDGSGMEGGRHDNDGSSRTMWHSAERPAPTRPAAGDRK